MNASDENRRKNQGLSPNCHVVSCDSLMPASDPCHSLARRFFGRSIRWPNFSINRVHHLSRDLVGLTFALTILYVSLTLPMDGWTRGNLWPRDEYRPIPIPMLS